MVAVNGPPGLSLKKLSGLDLGSQQVTTARQYHADEQVGTEEHTDDDLGGCNLELFEFAEEWHWLEISARRKLPKFTVGLMTL
jgi:hypothetical protein